MKAIRIRGSTCLGCALFLAIIGLAILFVPCTGFAATNTQTAESALMNDTQMNSQTGVQGTSTETLTTQSAAQQSSQVEASTVAVKRTTPSQEESYFPYLTDRRHPQDVANKGSSTTLYTAARVTSFGTAHGATYTVLRT